MNSLLVLPALYWRNERHLDCHLDLVDHDHVQDQVCRAVEQVEELLDVGGVVLGESVDVNYADFERWLGSWPCGVPHLLDGTFGGRQLQRGCDVRGSRWRK